MAAAAAKPAARPVVDVFVERYKPSQENGHIPEPSAAIAPMSKGTFLEIFGGQQRTLKYDGFVMPDPKTSSETEAPKKQPKIASKAYESSIPSRVTLLIFSFAAGKVRAQIEASCKVGYFRLKSVLTSREIMGAIGDQGKHYPLRTVVLKIAAFMKLFPIMDILDCSDLQLSESNVSSRDLIPGLMRAWPRDLHHMLTPWAMAGESTSASTRRFVDDVLRNVYINLPHTVTSLVSILNDPRQTNLYPISLLELEQIDCGNVVSLGCMEGDLPNAESRLLKIFPSLRHLCVALQTADHVTPITNLIGQAKNLQTLTLVNGTKDVHRLSLCVRDAVVNPVPNSSLRRLEVRGFWVSDATRRVFQKISPDLELIYEDCLIDLRPTRMRFTAQALRAYR